MGAANRSKRFVSFVLLREFAGVAASTYHACIFAKLQVRGIYDVLKEYSSRYSALPMFSAKYGLFNKRAKLNKTAYKELEFWRTLSPAQCHINLIAPKKVLDLYTDASTYRWGAVCNGVSVSGEFPESLQACHIGVKELYAVFAGL